MSEALERSGEGKSYLCSVPGCFNTFSTYFQMPDEVDKRRKWLKLIKREDLIPKTSSNINICEAHFNPSSVQATPIGKILAVDANPQHNLPRNNQTHARILSFLHLSRKTAPTKADKEVQTDPPPDSKMDISPGKRDEKCSSCRKRKKCSRDDWSDFEIFSYLCDKFLSKNLANAVKQKAVITAKK